MDRLTFGHDPDLDLGSRSALMMLPTELKKACMDLDEIRHVA